MAARRAYPHVRLIYWAGGNPFHHHQDLNRLVEAWRRPDTIIVHNSVWNAHARHADIVLPAAVQIERNDIVAASRDNFLAASHKLAEPAGLARTDYEILSAIARRMGTESAFTEGRDEALWLRHLYAATSRAAAAAGYTLPDFETFWREGVVELPNRETARTVARPLPCRSASASAGHAIGPHRTLFRAHCRFRL